MTIKLKQLWHRLFRPLPVLTSAQAVAVERLRSNLLKTPAPELSPGASEAERTWCANRLALREFLLTQDPRRFLWLDAVRHAMSYEAPAGAAAELAKVRAQLDFQERWATCLTDKCVPPPGAPRIEGLGPNLIHQAHHLVEFEQNTGVAVNRLGSILEFGGGYGAMCRVARQSGFVGRYVVFDLPEFLALQEFYLFLNPPVRVLTGQTAGQNAGQNAGPAPQGVSTLDLLQSVTPPAPLPGGFELLIAMWSLSETPISFRERFLAAIAPPRFYLLGLQDRFGEVDNMDWFTRWSQGQRSYRWTWVEIPHLPGNRYLLGVRADVGSPVPSA